MLQVDSEIRSPVPTPRDSKTGPPPSDRRLTIDSSYRSPGTVPGTTFYMCEKEGSPDEVTVVVKNYDPKDKQLSTTVL